jgi:tRNA(adenine34) deaminase
MLINKRSNAQKEQDIFWLQHALRLAKKAADENEVPVGAVIVFENQLIGEGYNQPIKLNDPTAHAEIIALRHAARKIGNYRLVNTSLYVTLEPCSMCAGALVHARIGRLVFGVQDKKRGAVMSQLNLLDLPNHHRIDWQGGLLIDQCSELLQNFFRARRLKKRLAACFVCI